MLNIQDQENLVKSSQTANLLVQALQALSRSDNPLLSEIALEVLQQAALLEKRLSRIEMITRKKEASA
jgi:hypothetical protein